MFATEPGTELVVTVTEAACPEPLYDCGELLTARVAVTVALFTVSVAAVVVAVGGLHELVKIARYWLLLIATVGLLIAKVVLVAPGVSVNSEPVVAWQCDVVWG